MGQLKIIGAKTNNLKNIDIELSKNQLIVVTGPSGSGKSSFAFDTIYAEGRRRYLSSLSSYGKQLLGQMRNAEFESIKGLTPSIAVQQKSAVFSPRSTVGTMTEINDHLRLLWARLGDVYCPNHHQIIKKYDPESIVNEILAKYRKGEILVCANFFQEKDKSLSIEEKKQLIQKNGFSKIWLANDLYRLEEISSDLADSDWLVCIDRLIIDKTDKIENRLFEAVESAFINGDGLLQIIINRQISNTYINRAECPICHFKIDHIEPRLFSFNTPEGACQECSGLGSTEAVDLSRVIPNKQLSLNEGVIFPNIDSSSDYYQSMLIQFAQSEGIDINKPFNQLSNAEQSKVLNGSNQKFLFKFNSYFSEINEKSIQFPGIIQQIENRYKKGMSIAARKKMGQYISDYQCEACKGQRLNDLALAVKIKDFAISEILDLQINDLIDFIQHLEFSKEKSIIFLPLKQLILDKLYFLEDIGLSYLSLSRNSNSLSGGEIQRIQLAAKISSKLTNIIYVLDEPSTGLHQRDKQQLINSLRQIVGLNNTVIVVEHDFEIIRSADFIVEFGKTGGSEGGHIISKGHFNELIEDNQSITGQYLSGKMAIPIPKFRRIGNGKELTITNIKELNLKNICVSLPLGKFIAITGVSGSGKSTLVNKVIGGAIANSLYNSKRSVGKFDEIIGMEEIKDLVRIDQAPIGKNNRSNLATYCGLFDNIRTLFSKTNAAKVRGYQARRFSYNVKGGRCETCEGEGIKKVDMSLLPDIFIICDVCHGKQFNSETLEVQYKGKNIAEVLKMSVSEALIFFQTYPSIKRKLEVFEKIGLGYLQLGQPASTLSGGEAQRIKLGTELAKVKKKGALYILDEPTNGLNITDIQKLIDVLQNLVDKGNTVLVIEHKMDLIKTVDHIIDLGPEGGEKGGHIISAGTPEEVAASANSVTGYYLKNYL